MSSPGVRGGVNTGPLGERSLALVHFSSERMDWPTPKDLVRHILSEINEKPLDLDVCASPENAKCAEYFTEEQDGLKQDWSDRRCWMNPPYGREINRWVRKAAESEARIVVGLIPARTDTNWWHRWVMPAAHSVYFLRGRVKFEGARQSAPFPSVVVVWSRKFYEHRVTDFGSFDASTN